MRILAAVALLCAFGQSVFAGTLTGNFSPVATGSNVNLTAVGKLDWVHWGLYTDSSINRKSVTPIIGNFNPVGDPGSYVAVYQYANNYNGYSWFDGWPVESVTNTTTGVWAYGNPISLNSGFQITVPADTSQKTLQVFVGAYNAKGKFTALLSDHSAPGFTNTQTGTVDNFSNGPGGVFSIDYAANSPGQTLTVTWTLALSHGLDANVTLQAAALTAPGADNPPYASITNLVSNATFLEPATIPIQVKAEDFDGSVTNVAFFAGTNKLGQTSASPYNFTWSGVSRGYYVLTAVATDNQGVSSSSHPVGVFVYGTGGTQTNSVALPPPATVDLTGEGTADWTHWGLTTNTSFDYKSSVSRKISNFTQLGTNAVQQYANNYTAYSWSDGTPTPSAAGTTTGVFVTGVTNGFLLTAPADSQPRELRVYVGGYGVQGEFQAYLSDLSAPPYTDTSVSNQFSSSYAVYTIDYSAASPGQLIVVYHSQNLFDFTYGNVTLQAATLQGGPSDPLPVYLVNPLMTGNDFSFSFMSQSNRNYVVESLGDLLGTNWTTVTSLPGTGGLVTVTNQNAGSGPKFYRVETQ